ncbi:hypothetical protein KAF44_25470 (plasmid) [Cupriavidus necator]|nr:hypothetical protein KAF44_25470 [Cupriavidus necator]
MNSIPSEETYPHRENVSRLLTYGGDYRISLDPLTLRNKYGCAPEPDSSLLPFGSATASTISEIGFLAAGDAHHRINRCLMRETPHNVYLGEIARLRNQIIDIFNLESYQGTEVVFSPSGTDSHILASKLIVGSSKKRVLSVMVQPSETGSGIKSALMGGECQMPFQTNLENNPFGKIDVESISLRASDCSARTTQSIDDDLESLVSSAIQKYDRILITLTDVSKTGLLSPSPALALALKIRWPHVIEILVDASQFRISITTLNNYIKTDFMVIVTGSKFLSGPTFSSVLLIPESSTSRLIKRPLTSMGGINSSRAEWPQHWAGVQSLPNSCNFGLILRWAAALAELRAFLRIPEDQVTYIARTFEHAVSTWLDESQHFLFLKNPALRRDPSGTCESWDHIQTIFPFIMLEKHRGRKAKPLSLESTRLIYNQMNKRIAKNTGDRTQKIIAARCEIGQPVVCGETQGDQVAALRLCLSSRLIRQAAEDKESGMRNLIDRGITTLEKSEFLVRRIRSATSH